MDTSLKPLSESDRMGTMPPMRLILRFALPSILTMVISSLYATVDKIFVGQGVGYLGLTATTVSTSVMVFTIAIDTLFGTGAAIMVATALGKGDRERARAAMAHGVAAQFAVGVLVTLAGLLFLRPICLAAGARGASLPYTIDYLRIIFIGGIAPCMGVGLAGLVRAQGFPRKAMIFSSVGAIINCFVDPLLIFIFHMGISGAAIATILAEIITAALITGFLLFGKQRELKISFRGFRPDPGLLGEMARLGFPSSFMSMLMGVMILIFMNTLQRYGAMSDIGGDVAISAMGICTSLGDVINMIGNGMQQGMSPLISYNYGAKKYDRVTAIFRDGFLLLLAILVLFTLILEFFPIPLIRLFGETANMDFAVYVVRVYNLALPTMAVQILGSMYLQATGQTKKANLVSLTRNVFFAIPLLLILPLFFGVRGPILMGPIADAGGALVSGLLTVGSLRRLKEERALSP